MLVQVVRKAVFSFGFLVLLVSRSTQHLTSTPQLPDGKETLGFGVETNKTPKPGENTAFLTTWAKTTKTK